MARGYSRLASVEEKRNMKKAVAFGILTVLTLVALFFYGIPTLGRFAAFISDFGKSGKTITTNDKTPPAPPNFSPHSDFTNQTKLDLSGSSEAGATVKLNFNGEDVETLADKDGHFTFSLTLNSGENSFTARAVDTAGNVSQPTNSFVIVYDNKPPDLNIDSPADGTQFVGSRQRQVTIQGTTEGGAGLTINDRVVAVDDNGKFQFTTTLTDGENKFNVKATDKAGNTTEKELTLSFVS